MKKLRNAILGITAATALFGAVQKVNAEDAKQQEGKTSVAQTALPKLVGGTREIVPIVNYEERENVEVDTLKGASGLNAGAGRFASGHNNFVTNKREAAEDLYKTFDGILGTAYGLSEKMEGKWDKQYLRAIAAYANRFQRSIVGTATLTEENELVLLGVTSEDKINATIEHKESGAEEKTASRFLRGIRHLMGRLLGARLHKRADVAVKNGLVNPEELEAFRQSDIYLFDAYVEAALNLNMNAFEFNKPGVDKIGLLNKYLERVLRAESKRTVIKEKGGEKISILLSENAGSFTDLVGDLRVQNNSENINAGNIAALIGRLETLAASLVEFSSVMPGASTDNMPQTERELHSLIKDIISALGAGMFYDKAVTAVQENLPENLKGLDKEIQGNFAWGISANAGLNVSKDRSGEHSIGADYNAGLHGGLVFFDRDAGKTAMRPSGSSTIGSSAYVSGKGYIGAGYNFNDKLGAGLNLGVGADFGFNGDGQVNPFVDVNAGINYQVTKNLGLGASGGVKFPLNGGSPVSSVMLGATWTLGSKKKNPHSGLGLFVGGELKVGGGNQLGGQPTGEKGEVVIPPNEIPGPGTGF